MWPQKKRRKRKLNLDEFKRALLEQWAKTHGIASNRVSILFSPLVNLTSPVTSGHIFPSNNGVYHRNHRHIRSVRVQPIPAVDDVTSGQTNGHISVKNGQISDKKPQGLLASTGIYRNGNSNTNNIRNVHYETRTKRFFRRLARVSRRVHFIRRLSRRIRRESIGPPLKPRIAINPALRPEAINNNHQFNEVS